MKRRSVSVPTEKLKHIVRRSLGAIGYGVYRLSDGERLAMRDYQRRQALEGRAPGRGIDLARLHELRERYSRVDLPIAKHSVWTAKSKSAKRLTIGWGGVDLKAFRGHGAYVWSYGEGNSPGARMKHFIFAVYAQSKDAARLLSVLREDDAFGCVTFTYPNVGTVSRDLLDSVIEINFLQKHLGVLDREDLRVLDIGAGYGRMAHRMLEANPRIKSYACVDAVPESTFLCERYLSHRGLMAQVQVVPMDELEKRLDRYDLALNIHSFSECTFGAIRWWLEQIRLRQIRYLMIVPNSASRFESMESDGKRCDYMPLLRELGYELIAQEPVFDDPAVSELMAVSDNMFLFELRENAR